MTENAKTAGKPLQDVAVETPHRLRIARAVATRLESRDITVDIGPLFSPREEPRVTMYSYSTPAYTFWQGAYDALIEAGSTDAQALAWLQSKNPRWMLDSSSSDVQELGRMMTARYILKNGGIV